MSDEPKDSLSTEYILKEVHDKEKKGLPWTDYHYPISHRGGVLFLH
jgi:hypothetical protein